ncbi:LTA synthase family protein [Lacticaseibacillus pabuli]|uniref:LTA synthase family protein n=1 Tax=Lacticaseibacillus pabuli TaxID=3025672 RepID=A0ABY7WNK8_9LACO|nr:LTA synthase family protein [Lacticaseibacillus sp. KACC 23028]WDF81793.1 LTA synthase family protein [Lacticaseibacillus sp. KACC 23028]
MANTSAHRISKRLRFILILLALIWAKTLIAYFFNFRLPSDNPLQFVIKLVNPIGTSLFLLSLSMYFRKPKRTFITAGIIYILLCVLLIANVLYYREFTDFMTISTVLGVSKVSQGLGATSISTLQPGDLVYFLDFILVGAFYLVVAARNVYRFLQHEPIKWPHPDWGEETQNPLQPLATTVAGLLIFMITMAVSELNRPQLLTRTFDRTYIVRYLGLAPFTVYDGLKTAQTSQVRAQASSGDMDKVLRYTQSHYAAPDAQYFGSEKGKNVIIIHLESFQQFLIGQKIKGKEVTPFLNSLIKNKNTLSFSNVFNQVGLGRTSDAENMLETSTFGLSGSSLFSTYGNDNTFQAAPAILHQTDGYTSAVMHGGNAEFWNRDSTYKSLGYNYFFSGNYYDHSTDMNTEFGIKDKLMFAESAKYLEHLQQPFYSKIITTSNHFPFSIDSEDSDFPDAGTDDVTVNNYFKTANYLDQSLREFFAYLKKSGLDKKSLVMIYGDHYGISDDRNKSLAPVLGKKASDWTSFDDAQLQRIPLIFYSPGLKGGQKDTYGGEIDVLPTLMHLLGVHTKKYVQFGTDLLSPNHDQVVAFRNRNFVTPDYTAIGSKYYLNASGQEVKPDVESLDVLKQDKAQVDNELTLSDLVATKNLLRFYTPTGFTPVDSHKYDYSYSLYEMLRTEKNAGNGSTSLYSERGDKSTSVLYKTNAPELSDDKTPITDYPSKVEDQTDVDSSSIAARLEEATSTSSSN